MKALHVTLSVPVERAPGRFRVVGVADGWLTVATQEPGRQDATSEVMMPFGEAVDLAQATIAGNSYALTLPHANRLLAALALVLLDELAGAPGPAAPAPSLDATAEPTEGEGRACNG